MDSFKEFLRTAYFRSRLCRRVLSWLIRDNRVPADFSQNLISRNEQVGPIHDDEALFLFGLTRVLCPRTIVEFGFRAGHSAFNFLLAAIPDCRVFSYDIGRESEKIARRGFGQFEEFRFIRKSQTEFSPTDIDNRKIDLCFIDASHITALNLETFDLIRPHLAEGAVVAVHDTGVWHRQFFKDQHLAYASSNDGRSFGQWLDAEQFQPAVTERLFVNAVLRTYPEFSQVHLHSAYTLRNGITLLQKKAPLLTGPGREN